MSKRAQRIVFFVVLVAALIWVRRSLILPLGPHREVGRAVPASTAVAVRVTPLRMGSATVPRCGMAGAASCLQAREMSHSAFLVQHPRGTFLIEAGLSSRGGEDVARFSFLPRQLLKFRPEGSLGTLLKTLKVTPDFVILTHAHWDHASGLRDLDHPRVIVGPGEQEFIKSWPATEEPSVQAEHFANAKLETVAWDGPAYETFAKSHDLFGDGAVVIVPMPGHTPGSIGVVVNGVHGRRVLFVGDAAWSRDGVNLPSHKPSIMSRMVDHDLPAVSDALWNLHDLQQREPDLLIVPTHDAAAFNELRALTQQP